jgi:hypothetical protein
MPYRRFDWHERVRAVKNEYKSVRIAVDRLKSAVANDPTVLGTDPKPANLGAADRNLEGTYLVRLFAEFESALRSYDRSRHADLNRKTEASILIDSIGGRRGQGISEDLGQCPSGRPRRAPGSQPLGPRTGCDARSHVDRGGTRPAPEFPVLAAR